MDALGDVKQLQAEQSDKLKGIQKQVDPPMTAPTSLRNAATTTLPGGVTFIDMAQGQQGFQPTYQVNLNLQDLREDIAEVQRRVDRAFYADLFMMMARSDRREITAREIEERHEEKLLMLGPVIERTEDELLDPLIDITFDRCLEAGILPPVPRELDGVRLGVEYISILAQAQRMVGTAGIERLTGYIGNLAAVAPEVVDKIDLDQSVDEYGEMLGVPGRVVRTDEQVAEIRQQRQQAQQQQQAAEQALAAAEGAKTLSEADTEGNNALTQLTSQLLA